MAAKQEILKQIDAAIDFYATHRAKSKYADLSDLHDHSLYTEVDTVLGATLERLAPPGSRYRESMYSLVEQIRGASGAST